MNYSDYRFTLDVQIHQAQVSVPVSLNDTARKLCIGLTDGRKPYTIADGCIASFVARKPDGTKLHNYCVIERNTVIYEFTPQTTNVEGVVNCEIRLQKDGVLLVSPQFTIVVDKQVVRDDEIVPSADEYTSITQLIYAESERQNTFIISENTRQSTFESAESTRQTAFESAETARQSTFESAEGARAAAETARAEAEKARVTAENARAEALDELATTQKKIVISGDFEGVQYQKTLCNLLAGSYSLHIDNLESNDSNQTRSAIVFFNGEIAVKMLQVPRNTSYDAPVVLTESVDNVCVYASLSYVESDGDSFKVSGLAITCDTELNKRISDVERLADTTKLLMDTMQDKLSIIPTAFEAGTIVSPSGTPNVSDARCRSGKILYKDNLKVRVDEGYEVYLHFYLDNECKGNSGGWIAGEVALSNYSDLGADSFRVVVRHSDESIFDADTIQKMIYYITIYSDNGVIPKLTAEVNEFILRWGIYPMSFQSGTIKTAENGAISESTTRCYSNAIPYSKDLIIRADSGVDIFLHFYNDASYIQRGGASWEKDVVYLSAYESLGATNFRVVVRNSDDTEITDVAKFNDGVIAYSKDKLFAELVQQDSNSFDYLSTELPVLELFGSTGAMTKDNAVTLNYKYGTQEGTCTCKWQGSSSVRMGYPKRNYTIKFDSEFEAKTGWGAQKKYCMKANWIDPSGTRNVVNARLWGQVVASRSNAVTDGRATAPNYGAIDGFPIIIAINGIFEGLYTFNIPKDGWMMNMGDGANEYLLASESNDLQSSLFIGGPALCDESDYSIEYKPNSVADSTVIESFNTLLQTVVSAGADWETTLAPYLDIDSVVDYFIFVNCIGGHDNLGKNILYGTYDGTKWFMSAYDLDTTYGSTPYAKPMDYRWNAWFEVVNNRNQFKESANMHRLAYLLYTYSKPRLKARYEELRAGVLSDENVWFMLTNFVNDIPKCVYNADAEKWTTMPATSTANISTYMDFYRMHCAYLDKEVAQFE